MQFIPIPAESIPASDKKTCYPRPFAALVEGRTKRKLGDYFGLSNFGVNLTELAPGSVSALLHHHSKQDEFIFILKGELTLILDDSEYVMKVGDCYGFKAGSGVASQLVNRSSMSATYIEIGDRSEGDEVEYPNDDLKAVQLPEGKWRFTHKNGRPW